MTFKDFIAECEMYPHSKENFDLMKECIELSLTEKFMEDQAFMLENSSLLIENAEMSFSEGYFSESVDQGVMDVMMEKFNMKQKNITEKIYLGLKKIIGVFKNFFMKIGNKFDEITATGQAVKAKLAAATITDEDIASIKTIVANAKNRAQSFPVAANQPYLSKIKFGKYASSDPEVTKLKNDLAAALSDTVVVASVPISNSETIGAIPAEDIEDACARLIIGKGKLSNIVSVGTFLASSYNTAKNKGIRIRVNTKEINNLAEKLQKISDKISEIGRGAAENVAGNVAIANMGAKAVQKLQGDKDAPGMDDEFAEQSAKVTEVMNKCYGSVTAAIGQSMKIYTGLNMYRSSVITSLDSFLKTKSKDSKDDKK